MPNAIQLSYADRAELCTHPVAKQLLLVMDAKSTNLCVNPDVVRCEELLRIADAVGPEICLLKTHVDILEDFSRDVIHELQALAQRHNFLIFEDRKFADIGSVVQEQYAGGIYQIADWAHITNAHTLPGAGIIEGLQTIGMPKGRGLLLLAEMSSQGNLLDERYTQATVEMAKDFSDFVMGFICQKRLTDDPRFLHLTPGVNLASGGDALGQRYRTPQIAINEQGCDIIIVGRGIYAAKDPAAEAARYRKAGAVTCQR